MIRHRALLILLAVLLLASSLSLVTSQHVARDLFVDLESAQREARQLEADGNRLRIDLSRASQPAMVEAAAHRLGMTPTTPPRTVLVPGILPAQPGAMGAAAPPAPPPVAMATLGAGR
jgi:cell division protein FtsL